MFEIMNADKRGEAVKPVVETDHDIKRSKLFSIKDKTVLVLDGGGFSKRFIWDTYPEYGIKIVLVDHRITCYGAPKVDHFITYNYTNHKEDTQHARNIFEIPHANGIHVDGCVTFWEDCCPLAAIICSALGFRCAGEQAAVIAKNKYLTHKTLNAISDTNNYFSRPNLYSCKVVHIENESDISSAIDYVGLPAVMKLTYGSGAIGVKPIFDHISACDMFKKLKTSFQIEQDHYGIGLGHGNDLLLMEILTGTEYDIDIIMFNGQLVTAIISDSGPTRSGSYTVTTATMPTYLEPGRQRQLITAAYQCCAGIGLVDGVFNVEMKMTNCGPKLLEINARMGGFYLRDWILTCYGIDILLSSFMICLGIRPIIPVITPRCRVIGMMCLASIHKNVFNDSKNLNMLHSLIHNGVIKYFQIEDSIENCGREDEEEPFCNIAVVETDSTAAKQKLFDICTLLGLHNDQYDVEYFLSDFN